MTKNARTYLRFTGNLLLKTLKIILWVVLGVLLLILLVMGALRLPSVREAVAKKASTMISDKLHTSVRVGSFDLGLANTFNLRDVYAEDQNGDTLLRLEALSLDIDLRALFDNRLVIEEVSVHGLVARVSRHFPDTNFNYSFILSAFAAPAGTVVADTSAAPWTISLDRVKITSTRLAYYDDQSGVDLYASIGDLNCTFREFDLDRFVVSLREVKLNNTSAIYRQIAARDTSTDTTTAADPWKFSAGRIGIGNTSVQYAVPADSSLYAADVNSLSIAGGEIDLGRSAISVKAISLGNSKVTVLMPRAGAGEKTVTEGDGGADSTAAWSIAVQKLMLHENTFSYRVNGSTEQAGFNPSHMRLKGLSMDARNIGVHGEEVAVDLRDLRLREQQGFELRSMRGRLRYHRGGASAEQLAIRTSGSRIGRELKITYTSLDSLIAHPETALIDVELKNSVISLSDVYYFQPALSNSLALSPGEKISLNASLHGSLNDLRTSITARWRSSEVKAKGEIRQLMNTEKLYARLPAFSLQSGSADIQALLPPNTIPANITLPAELTLVGDFEGYLKNFNTHLELRSTLGQMVAEVAMDPPQGNVAVPYKGKVVTRDLQLGTITGNRDLGALTFSVSADGSGYDTSAFDTQLGLQVTSFQYKGYNYKDLVMNGHLLKSSFQGKARMRDDNLAFDFNGLVNLDKSAPRFVFDLELMGADLKKLHLSESDTRVSVAVKADLTLPVHQNPLGKAGLYNLVVMRDGRRHKVDSLVLNTSESAGSTTITLMSDKLKGELKGRFLVEELAPSLMAYVNSHFDLEPSTADTLVRDQQVEFSLSLVDPAFLTTGLIPGLEKLSPALLEGSFDSRKKELKTKLEMAGLVYSGVKVEKINLDVTGDGSSVRYLTSLAQVSDSTNFKFENMLFSGEMKNDVLGFQFVTAKDDSVKVLAFGGNLHSRDGAFELRLAPEMILNRETWTVDTRNSTRFGPRPLHIDHLLLSNATQSLGLRHTTPADDSPLEISFESFELGTIAGLMEHKDKLVTGQVNGQVILEQQNNASAFKSDISIRDLTFKAAYIGNVTLKADNFADPGTYDIRLVLSGAGNDLELGGSYDTRAKTNNLDFDLRVGRLQMAALEAFTGGEVTRMSGWLGGSLAIRGEPSRPMLKGRIGLHEVAFRPRMIDSYLRIPAGDMVFEGHQVRMNDLLLLDSLNNKATLGGYVDIANLSAPAFDLKLRTDNFLAMNTDKRDNELYFGKIFLDSDVRITGTADRPTVNVKANLNRNSSLTYIKPESQILRDESKGIVEFTDSLDKYARIMTREDSAKVKGIVGLELNAEITVDREVDLKVIVDPIAGDSLYIRGGGRLNFTMERNGTTGLAGKYNISKGGYFLKISDFVKRDFTIEPGSSVTWSGDPLDAYVDLSAIYKVKASPIDLVQDQMSGMTEVEANKFRNLLTFHVYLKMTGFISSPQISFDIQLAPEDRGAMGGAVGSRLAQLKADENQLNKQVFALLTLRRFVGENPLESSGGGGFSSAGRSSASKVLTQQLSTLSDRYVNFVDLDLGVNSYEDYSTGQAEGRTQVQVGVSKQLFNDRVTIRVGGNVDVEGEKAQQNTANDVAGNIGIDYKLTEDGRWKLKAFRENQYENPIEGEITKTGTGIVFTRDFNRFKNLFRKPRAQRQLDAKRKHEAAEKKKREQEEDRKNESAAR